MKITDSKKYDFNFDEWAKLAEKDPERFEKMRAEQLQRIILNAPRKLQKRLEGLQWKIDTVREQADNPMAACMRMSKMMWDNVLGEDGLLESMQALTDSTPRPEKAAAKVLTFQIKEENE